MFLFATYTMIDAPFTFRPSSTLHFTYCPLVSSLGRVLFPRAGMHANILLNALCVYTWACLPYNFVSICCHYYAYTITPALPAPIASSFPLSHVSLLNLTKNAVHLTSSFSLALSLTLTLSNFSPPPLPSLSSLSRSLSLSFSAAKGTSRWSAGLLEWRWEGEFGCGRVPLREVG